ncbi:alanine dehydrogenase [bacterium CG_4_9_14_3_um_filter_65_15]|nr:MAG: alanine dehydrogenase [bacterium CG_4_9_14_3_um_filter_65_15]
MIIGIPRSRVSDEYRVGLPPRMAGNLVRQGWTVLVEKNAGAGSGFPDAHYERVGADICHQADEVWGRAELILKVNTLARAEYDLVRPGQILMSVFHLAVADRKMLERLLEIGCTVIDYVTIEDDLGRLPVLRPLSQIAGRMVPQIAARYLQTDHGGTGILLGGAPAVPPAEVTIIGAGTVGRNAVRACLGAGARVTLLDSDLDRIAELDWMFPGRVTTYPANEATISKVFAFANVVVGAVLVPGTRTPHLVTRPMVGLLRPGSLVIDISVDQGGCFATSRPTRLSDPTYVVDGVTHYCVPNLPSLVARSASYAMANAAMPYVQMVAEGSLSDEATMPADLRRGVNIQGGRIRHAGLARIMGLEDPS